MHFPSTAGLPGPDNAYSPVGLLSQYGPMGLRAMSDDQRKELNRQIRSNEFQSLRAVQKWWLNRMLTTPAPLQEKMALYFHGHFTSAATAKGRVAGDDLQSKSTLSANALGNLRELTRNVSKDPAMLVYLDNDANVESHPNENYARELMELFTLGVNQYSEEDVRELGARLDRLAHTAAYRARRVRSRASTTTASRRFSARPATSPATTSSTSSSRNPQCARFFATSLLSAFVYNDPEPQLVDGVAALLRQHDFELAPVMATILRSNVFYSAPRLPRAGEIAGRVRRRHL